MDHAGRISRLSDGLEANGIDALLVTSLANVRYLTGFSGTNGQVLLTRARAVFLTDPRYRARASEIVKGADVVVYDTRLEDELPGLVKQAGIAHLGVEADAMTLSDKTDLVAMLPGVDVVETKELVETLRRSKEPAEVDRIREAVRLADEAYGWILDRVVPGSSERQIALDLEVQMRSLGADQVSFEPIVGSGALSAHIHHTASTREFEKGDLILMDFGARVDGYCSDITRTVVLGPATDDQRSIYEIVLEAQKAGIEAISVGAGCKDVDAAARAVIDGAGYGDTFAHGLGHGVGIDIHEAPRFSKASTDALVELDVVTVEPGIYVAGIGGIRIEDDVLVTHEGPVVLNGAPKDVLIEL